MRHLLRFVAVACTIGAGAQVLPRPAMSEEQIAAAEAAGAAFPRAGQTPAERKCTLVKPDRIVFPSTQGDPADFNLVSGEFLAGSISFGWDKSNEQAKMPLWPLRPDAIGNGLKMQLTRIDPPGEQRVLEVAGVNWGCFVLDRPMK